ncbi:MAG TPA: hypothetical protein VF121_14640 [Thermoanaerobaculia bacterium]|nr:hypothetical protein [Thermoanaerobaculia bacterium]
MSDRNVALPFERTVKRFVEDANRVLGADAMQIRYVFWSGLQLYYRGNSMAFGGVSETHLLTVAEQEAICLYFDLDQTLFGLDARTD